MTERERERESLEISAVGVEAMPPVQVREYRMQERERVTR